MQILMIVKLFKSVKSVKRAITHCITDLGVGLVVLSTSSAVGLTYDSSPLSAQYSYSCLQNCAKFIAMFISSCSWFCFPSFRFSVIITIPIQLFPKLRQLHRHVHQLLLLVLLSFFPCSRSSGQFSVHLGRLRIIV
jgi:hypothetical protein